MTIGYSTRFQQVEAVNAYETGEYAPGSYSSHIWSLQRPVVEGILNDFRRNHPGALRLLDFACGTGRVLATLENFADPAEGIDISENMVAVARAKCARARLHVGDILADPGLLAGQFDVITCFRFLLNVESTMRQRVLARLREVLRPGGLLLVNVHGSSRSVRHPAILWRRWRNHNPDSMLNEMPPAEAERMLWNSGFKIVRKFGFGLLPPTLYRTPLRGMAYAGDRLFAGENLFKGISIDLLYVCQPR